MTIQRKNSGGSLGYLHQTSESIRILDGHLSKDLAIEFYSRLSEPMHKTTV
jgi:hypothetical protein